MKFISLWRSEWIMLESKKELFMAGDILAFNSEYTNTIWLPHTSCVFPRDESEYGYIIQIEQIMHPKWIWIQLWKKQEQLLAAGEECWKFQQNFYPKCNSKIHKKIWKFKRNIQKRLPTSSLNLNTKTDMNIWSTKEIRITALGYSPNI